MAGRPSLTRRLRLLVGGVGLALVLVIAGLGATVADFRDDVNRRDDLIPAAGDAAQLTGIFVDRLQSTDVVGTVALGSEEFADTRQAALVLLGRLERELADHPPVLRQLSSLRTAVVFSGNDPTQLTSLVAKSEALTATITESTERAADTAEQSRTRFVWAVGIAAGVALLLLVIGATGLRRWFVKPVRALAADVTRVADGEYGHPLVADSSSELAQLASSVARMRDRILAERDRALRATEAVGQQAPAVAALRTLLEPRVSPPSRSVTVAGGLVAAEGELAGDWYDLAARDDLTVITLGDVCGHGVEAGVLAVRTKFALLDAITLGLDPAAALALAAERFARDDTFVTAIVAELDPANGRCRYASAGHNPALILRADGELVQLHRTGPLIGLVDGDRPNVEVALGPGDLLVLYTDGVVEARDDAGDQLHIEGLEALLREHLESEPERIVEAITAAVLSRCGGRCPDDATVVVARIH